MAYLVLVRHGLTDWNKQGRWQGLTDISLNEEGREQSRQAAATVKDIHIDFAYMSNLIRTKQTLDEIFSVLNLNCPVISDQALNERDYGIYTGKNKWEVKKRLGEEEFLNLRRGWNQPIPNGESLKDVYERVVPFYKGKILPELKLGKNAIIVSSGNTLRALMKFLENLSDEEISQVELGVGDVYVFQVDQSGHIIDKQIRAKNLYQGKIQ